MGLLSSTPSLREGVLRCGKAITVTTEGAMSSDMKHGSDRERLDRLRAMRDAAVRDMGYFSPNPDDAYASTEVSLTEVDAEIAAIELKLGLESQ